MVMGSNAFKKGFLALIATLSVFIVFAQTFTPKTVSITANCGGYYEYLPTGYSTSNQNYPVVFYLHSAAVYGNGSATALKNLLTEGIPYYINNGKFPSSFTVKGETTSLIVIAPQFIAKPSMADVKAVIDYISSKYRIDKARIYLTGHSVGGDATIKYPNTGINPAKQLAAIAASSSFNNPYVDSGAVYIAAANLPVRMYHSTDDTQSPYTWSQKFVNKINSYNPSVKANLILFNGYTHNVAWQREFDPAFRDSGYNVYEWLLNWRRDQAPFAVTGKDTSIIYPTNSVQLKGDASYDPDKDVITYSWRKLTGPAEFSINNASIADPLVSGLLPGVYTFQLTVTDPFAYTSTSSVTITVINPNPNILPVAKAGGSQSIEWPINSVSLNGSASSDSDGVIESYNWKLFSGNPGFKISDTSASITTVSGLKPGSYKFLLTVTDNQGATGTDTASISIINLNSNSPPVVNAGNDTTIYLPNNTFTLKASASDPDGQIISYKWKKVSGPDSYSFSDSTILNPTLTSLTEGTYQFSLSVKDDSLSITTDTVKLVVSAVQRILIDIGPVLTTNPDQWGKYWNNMTDGRAGIRVTNAITTLNQTTTLSLEVVNRIDGTYNTSATGLNSGNGTGIVGDYTANATDDYAFSYEGTTNGRWRIFGLNPQSTYTIKFWGTRATTADRIIQIKKTTDSVWISYNAANNKNPNTAAVFTVSGVSEVSFDILTKTGSTYGYINIIDINVFNTASSANQPPVAYAGPDQMLALPNNTGITLAGTASDPDGTIASTLWTQLTGPSTTTIASNTSVSTTAKGFIAGNYSYELKVTDNSGAIIRDTMVVKVLPPAVPRTQDTINCGKSLKIVVLGSSTSYGNGAVPVDSSWVNKYLLYIKSKNANNSIVNLSQPGYTTYDALMPSGYIPPSNRPVPDSLHNITKALSLHPDVILINLPSNDIAFDFTLTEQKNNYAVAKHLADSAGVPLWISTTQPRTNLNLQERDSLKVFRDWTISTYGPHALDFWTTVANADGSINDLYSYGDNVHFNNAGHNILYARVVESRILDSMCIRSIPVIPPPASKVKVNAGIDQVITLPVDSTIIAGSVTDSGSIIKTYKWVQVNGPSLANLLSADSLQTTINGLLQGEYIFRLKATDALNNADSSIVKITVNPASAASIVHASAGANLLITLPVNSVILTGNASDSGSVIASYLWTQLSGPSTSIFANHDSLQTRVDSLVQGNYVFQLKVTDSLNNYALSTTQVIVNPAPNKLPVVTAGAPQSITLPVNSVTVNGSASDSDGTISKVLWSQLSGPSTASIVSPNSLSSAINGLIQGTYQFQLKATDNSGGSSVASIQITVNQAPVSGTTKFIKVQIYGGTGAYIDPQWNNWNVGSGSSSNSSSGTFKYSDGSLSAISGFLSNSQAVGDNNSTYASTITNTMCPPAVLRFTSYSGSLRTLTINGLNSAVKYSLEIYASRYSSGNTSIFTVNGVSVTITTYDNYTNKAAFSNIVPNTQGQIVVTIDKGSTYNYINGFTLTEQGGTNAITARNVQSGAPPEINSAAFEIYPNPIHNNCTVTLNNSFKGVVKATITNLNGVIIKQYSFIKNEVQKNWILALPSVSKGIYIILLEYDGYKLVRKVIKQ